MSDSVDADGRDAAQLRRIQRLLAALPADLREEAEADIRRRIEDPAASLRKAEKALRRRALGLRFDEAAAALSAEDAGLVAERADGGWALRLPLTRTVHVEVGEESLPVELRATLTGPDAEARFVADPPVRFARLARRVLERRLDRAEARLGDVRETAAAFLAQRADNVFYDRLALRRVVHGEVQRALSDDEVELLGRRLERAAAPLDRRAGEKEIVRSAIHDRQLLVYKDLFPRARELGRRLTFFCGPTNSGKTWHALNRLAEAGSGAYLAPLRLLALEGQEELGKRGVLASFLTGEERDLREGARFVASTIEMLNPEAVHDAVVIDEIQMLGDRDRGWAWTQALIGAAARDVFLTGSPDAIPLVRAVAEYLGEPLEIVPLERHTSLEPLGEAVPLHRIRPGTAVIAFSRRDVIALKEALSPRYTVAVIYGNLTPEVRREEARRFRSGEAEVLCASDAIGLGLNLPIETIVLSTLRKWDGVEERPLTPSELVQIGGRAGRFGKYESGYVAAMEPRDVRRIREVFGPEFTREPLAGPLAVRPGAEHVGALAAGLETRRLGRVLSAFRRAVHFDVPLLEPSVTDSMERLAEMVDRHTRLPLEQRLLLASAPVDERSDTVVRQFAEWVEAIAEGRTAELGHLPGWIGGRAAADEQMQRAETEAKRLMLYAWLAFRDARTFPELERCQGMRQAVDAFIERSLAGRRTRFQEAGDGAPVGRAPRRRKRKRRRRG